jgi:hypothetical protein
MSGVMPPEPPPPASEADYLNGGAKRHAATVIATQDVGVFGISPPVPQHLISRSPTPELNKAQAAVLAESDESIPKRGYNKFHQYAYATADDLRMHVAQIIGKHGLSYEQHHGGYTMTPYGSMAEITYWFVLKHSSGEERPPQRFPVFALLTNKSGGDDKAMSKAMVLALKDWSKSTFSISTGDMLEDPDADDSRPLPPVPTQQPTQHRAAGPKKSDGTQAFRNAGLPPKVEKAAGQPDAWVEGVIAGLDAEQNGPKWLELFSKQMPMCTTMGQVLAIKRAKSVQWALKEFPPEVKRQIESLLSAATDRLGAALEPGPSDAEVEHASG